MSNEIETYRIENAAGQGAWRSDLVEAYCYSEDIKDGHHPSHMAGPFDEHGTELGNFWRDGNFNKHKPLFLRLL